MGDRGYPVPLPSLVLQGYFGFGSEIYVCVYLFCVFVLQGIFCIWFRDIYVFVCIYVLWFVLQGYFCFWFRDICAFVCIYVLWFVLHESRRISLNKHQNNPVGQPV
jgi:hypothetical protein